MERLKDIVLQVTPRILGFINRDRTSKTYGCCDRYFWHYKLHDIANARFQETCLLLTLLYQHDFEGNIFYKKRKVLDWIFAIIRFWSAKLNKDGSAVEVYPFEKSSCATAFSTLAILEAFEILLNGDDPEREECFQFIETHNLKKTLDKTGTWIARSVNYDVANQTIAAALGLKLMAGLLKNSYFERESEKVLNHLKADFQKCGYFLEYGGFDMGYLSISNSCFAWYCRHMNNNDELKTIISRINDKIKNEIDALGNYDYSQTSRNTQFLYLYGFTINGDDVIQKVLTGIAANKVLTPLWMDDRYCIALAIDYLKTYLDSLS